MPNAVIFLALPCMAFLVIALMPRGRPAFWAALTAAALLGLLWTGLALDLPGHQARGDYKAQHVMFLTLASFTLAWFLASSMQVMHLRFPAHWPKWTWPATCVLTLVIVVFGIYRMILI